MPLFPKISDDQIDALRLKEPTAFRVSFEKFGDLAFRKPRRAEFKRLQDTIRKGGDPEFIVSQCLLAPALSDWEAAIEQEAVALPTTALDALLKESGLAAEYDVGK